MSEVFTSYSRRDTEPVDHVVGEMKESGLSVWIDREEIKAGNQWSVQIVEAIDTCDAFTLMLSPNSAASDNVRKEIDLAQDSGRKIFAMMLEPVKIPATIRYQLAGLQFLDVKMLGFESASRQLIATIKEHIKKLKPVPADDTRQTELVIQGVDISAFTPEKQQQLLDFISKLADTDASKLKIEKMEAGSLHVFVKMPSKTAFQLKTLALNRDKRLKKMGIVSLRLAGNKKFINTTFGILTPTAMLSPAMAFWLGIPPLFSSTVGIVAGKLLTTFSAVVVVSALGIFASSLTPDLPLIPPTITSTLTVPPIPASTGTFTPIPTPTRSAAPTLTPTPENTFTPTATASPTSSPTLVYGFLDGVVVVTEDRIACRYGPGDPYLFKFEPISGNKIKVYGKTEIQKGDTSQVWLFGLLQGYPSPCWVNAKYIQLNGNMAGLEPYYPDKRAPLLLFRHPKFPPPKEVSAKRDGDQVFISWTGYILALGDRESANSPVYLVEAWTCQGGKIVFTPVGAYEEFASVKDEAGCSEPSHGQVFVAHKDGYVGPVEVTPWP